MNDAADSLLLSSGVVKTDALVIVPYGRYVGIAQKVSLVRMAPPPQLHHAKEYFLIVLIVLEPTLSC